MFVSHRGTSDVTAVFDMAIQTFILFIGGQMKWTKNISSKSADSRQQQSVTLSAAASPSLILIYYFCIRTRRISLSSVITSESVVIPPMPEEATYVKIAL